MVLDVSWFCQLDIIYSLISVLVDGFSQVLIHILNFD